jgi:hypothetical protein
MREADVADEGGQTGLFEANDGFAAILEEMA